MGSGVEVFWAEFKGLLLYDAESLIRQENIVKASWIIHSRPRSIQSSRPLLPQIVSLFPITISCRLSSIFKVY